jgi:hypothetical protein
MLYSVLRMMLRPEIVRMSYLALNEKDVSWRGKTKDSGVSYHFKLNFWGSKTGHLPSKRKGGHTASRSNCKLTKNYKKSHVNVHR